MTTYNKRMLARIVIEASTPLSIGSGDKDIITDSLVIKDVNGLPYIPGTSIAGVLRHSISGNLADDIFGYQDDKGGKGSRIIFSEARLINSKGKVLDGLLNIDFNDPFLSRYVDLPIRQHASLNDKGTARNGGKFDEQIVFKGSRFCFEMEMVYSDNPASDKNKCKEQINYNEVFHSLLDELTTPSFRLGSGTRNGFGEILVVADRCKTAQLNLSKDEDLDRYLGKSSSLADEEFWECCETRILSEKPIGEKWDSFRLTLRPDDFILFSSGFGDDKTDITPVEEMFVEWDNLGHGKFSEGKIVIPASSVKGAIAHRVAFHYNSIKGWYADNSEAKVGSDNEAVLNLFGGTQGDSLCRGNVIMSDIINCSESEYKVLNHVSIDNFTGGAIDGALFSEQVVYAAENEFVFNIHVSSHAFENEKIKAAFIKTLEDICEGLLPLGGGTNRGHGCFTGKYTQIA